MTLMRTAWLLLFSLLTLKRYMSLTKLWSVLIDLSPVFVMGVSFNIMILSYSTTIVWGMRLVLSIKVCMLLVDNGYLQLAMVVYCPPIYHHQQYGQDSLVKMAREHAERC